MKRIIYKSLADTLRYDTGTEAYPQRPDEDVPVEYIGPSAPSNDNLRMFDTWIEAVTN